MDNILETVTTTVLKKINPTNFISQVEDSHIHNIKRNDNSLFSYLLSLLFSTITFTFSSWTIFTLVLLLFALAYIVFRYRILTRYSRLPVNDTKGNSIGYDDLRPDIENVNNENSQSYQDFFVVAEGEIQVFVKSKNQDDEDEVEFDVEYDNKQWSGHILLNEVQSGGTVSSLFNILSVFTDGLNAETDPFEASSGATPDEQNDLFPGLRRNESNAVPSNSVQVPPLLNNNSVNLKISETNVESEVKVIYESINDFSDGDNNKTVLSEKESELKTISEKNIKCEVKEKNKSNFGYKNLHPDIVARASKDATMVVIPAEAFKKLAEKYPSAAAGIVQVILVRFQRVTFNTLYRYLGLSKELLKIEKNVNKFSNEGLPVNFMDGDWEEYLERLRERFGLHGSPSILQNHSLCSSPSNISKPLKKNFPLFSDTESTFQRPGNPIKNLHIQISQSKSTANSNSKHSVQMKENYNSDADYDDSEFEVVPNSGKQFPVKSKHFFFDDMDEDELRLKQCCFDLISKLIGFCPNITTPVNNSKSHSMRDLQRDFELNNYLINDLLNGYSPKKSQAKRRLSIDSNTEDDMSTTSSIGAGSNVSLLIEPANDLQILHYKPGDILCKEGDRVEGVYLVIDGYLEASMKSSINEMANATSFTSSKDLDNEYDSKKVRTLKKSLFIIGEGGLAGYLSALTGHPSFITLLAKTDVLVAFLPKLVLDKYVEKSPKILLTLAERLINQLSPVVLHIDIALEWGHVPSGHILCRQNEKAEDIYVVLSGRLRTILEGKNNDKLDIIPPESPKLKKKGNSKKGFFDGFDVNDGIGTSFFPVKGPSIATSYFEILQEHGQGESVGELEALTGSRRLSLLLRTTLNFIFRPGTLHAIRDSEVAVIPKNLFVALSVQHPAITVQISRIIAKKSQADNLFKNPDFLPGGLGSSSSPYSSSSTSATLASNNCNLKTVAILPVHANVPIAEFADRLQESLVLLGASVAVLNTSSVMARMGKHAFSKLGRLKLTSWLNEMEDRHRLVLYVADGGVGSPWTQRCIRQADCLMLIGLGDEDPSIGEYERLLIGMKTTARKELVLLHSERHCLPGSTSLWLKNRGWIHAHHHVQMRLKTGNSYSKVSQRNVPTLTLLRSQIFAKYYTADSQHIKKAGHSTDVHSGLRSDFARLGRRLLSKSIGLVLGGGGARGIAHVGIIQAFEEAGIPVDMVGGTSIGSFVGGLYARENDAVSIYGRAKSFSNRMSSLWRKILDITYPFTALFTGHEFNRGIWKVFLDTRIEDCWLPYFAITTNITWSRMEAHRFGYMWRYIRASMSLSGLLDGGYLNNLPADVMKVLGADTVIAVDVGSADDNSDVNYGDSLSGWWVMWCRMNPLAGIIGPDVSKIPAMAEIQSRLAYVSCVKQLETAKSIDGVLYLRPPVNHYGTLEFGKYDKIFQCGYEYGKEIVANWERDSVLEELFGIKTEADDKKGRQNRRASI
ncbi:Neuropathy target esterase [Clydaea vesicula]|uniref:Lysophospholipase NTE1 n=1 Tax=Clydaea vesicula TaxID=447962 RepID=A0AAD5UC72_9FUNG|nr:Neuropathy target esterase [Clydaea vesicula]